MWSKALIVADHPVLRFGLKRLISQEQDFEVCGEAGSASEALAKTETQRPDIAVVALPLENGLHPVLFPQMKAKYPALKILTGIRSDDPSLSCRVIRAGADGCIHWGVPVAELIEAIRAVLRGKVYLGERASKQLLRCSVVGESADGNVESLSDRELHVFAMIGQGTNTQKIAKRLDLSPRTVESHRKKIKLKLGLQNAAQLHHCAFQWWQEHS